MRKHPKSAPASPDSFDDAFRQLFAEQFPPLFRYLDRLSGDSALAADLAQEAFVRLFQRGELPEHPPAWLVSVAHNLFRNERGRARRHLRLLAGAPPDLAMSDAPPPPDRAVLRQGQREAVRAALEEIPERERQLLLLRYEGYSYQEIARALDLNEGSVGTLLARARSAFRTGYRSRYGTPE